MKRKPTEEECGCQFLDSYMVKWCAKHRREHDERHDRAMDDYRKAHPSASVPTKRPRKSVAEIQDTLF